MLYSEIIRIDVESHTKQVNALRTKTQLLIVRSGGKRSYYWNLTFIRFHEEENVIPVSIPDEDGNNLRNEYDCLLERDAISSGVYVCMYVYIYIYIYIYIYLMLCSLKMEAEDISGKYI